MVNGYTYSQMKDSDNYYCSKKNTGCKARVKFNNTGKLLSNCILQHVHPPPNYVITAGGRYIKLQRKNLLPLDVVKRVQGDR